MNDWLPDALAPKVTVSRLPGESASPQFTSRVKVSSVPGSVIVPVRVAVPSSSIDSTGSSARIGATLVTSTVVEPETLPVSSSVTITLIGMLSTGVPVGLSSRNWCVTLNVPAERLVRV